MAAAHRAAAPEGSGGVVAVERTVRLLGAFDGKRTTLSLAEMSERAQLHKSTALRMARTLAWAQYLVQLDDKTWRLGPAAGWLGACYQDAFDLNNVVMPMLKQLAQTSGQSASLFVRESNTRTCLFRVEAPQDTRPSVRPGTAFPLSKGAPGRVILAFSGEPGEAYETIRRQGYGIGTGERATDDASLAAPVFGVNRRLLGAISVSWSASRSRDMTAAQLKRLASSVVEIARQASRSLGANRQVRTLAR